VEISRTNDAIVLGEMDPFLADLLRQIDEAAQPAGSEAAEQRLFSSPTSGSDRELDADWREYVRPEIEHVFQTARETVLGDLEKMALEDGDDGRSVFTVRLPVVHLDAWLNSLNQARLSLAARHSFTEKEMEHDLPNELSSPRAIALFQIHFYGILQEVILRDLD
jgi:hypothetical protein